MNALQDKIYTVGGVHRNTALGIPAADIDYAVEATREQFEAAFPTAKYIGVDFPVYLFEKDEYALTREEESTGDRDKDFVPKNIGTSIYNDLGRRDFTFNSIAQRVSTGEIIDPHGGLQDIERRIIRTIFPQAFLESSVRIYRMARFAAELNQFGFTIEPETLQLAREAKHKIAAIDAHRVRAELKKAYDRSVKPSIFFRVLQDADALRTHFKPLHLAQFVPAGPSQYHQDKTVLDHSLEAFDRAKQKGHSFAVALASLFHDTGKVVTKKDVLPHHYQHEIRSYLINKQLVKQHRFNSEENELIVIAARHHMTFHALTKIKKRVKLIRFFRLIKNHFDDVVRVADNDHELSPEQLKILADLKRTFKEAVIVPPPPAIAAKGKEATKDYVDQQYTAVYTKISRGEL